MAHRERRDGDREVAGERGGQREREGGELDGDDRAHRAQPRRDEPAVEQRAEAAGEREDPEHEAERAERHGEAIGKEEVDERQEAAGAEPEDGLDDEEPSHERVAPGRVERRGRHRHLADQERRDDGERGDDAAARDERPQHERVAGCRAEREGRGGGERAGEHAREERGGRAQGDLLSEPGRAPRHLGRVREERRAGRGRDDAAEADQRRGDHEERKEGERDDRDKTEAGERPAGEDRGAARVPPGERGGGDRARDDADGLRADEDADAELAEAERAIEEVEVEGGHAEAEAADGGGREVQERVAATEGRCYCGWPSVTSTDCSLPSRKRVSLTLSPGRNRTSNVWSGCVTSMSWSFTFVMMSFGRRPACCAGEPGTTCDTMMPAVPAGSPSCAACRGESSVYWMPMKPRTIFPFRMSSSATCRTVLLEIANPRPVALLATSVFTPMT